MRDFLKKLSIEKVNSGGCTGQQWLPGNGSELESISPIDGKVIATVRQIDEKADQYDQLVNRTSFGTGD